VAEGVPVAGIVALATSGGSVEGAYESFVGELQAEETIKTSTNHVRRDPCFIDSSPLVRFSIRKIKTNAITLKHDKIPAQHQVQE
jgi:hypothetical protein